MNWLLLVFFHTLFALIWVVYAVMCNYSCLFNVLRVFFNFSLLGHNLAVETSSHKGISRGSSHACICGSEEV